MRKLLKKAGNVHLYVTLRRLLEAIIPVEKQEVLHTLSVCL